MGTPKDKKLSRLSKSSKPSKNPKPSNASKAIRENINPNTEHLTPLELKLLMEDFYQSAKNLGIENAEDFLIIED